jgi:Golgi phosphoprotein 3
MSTSTSGLTRRRGGGGGGAADGDSDSNKNNNGVPNRSNSSSGVRDSAPETNYENGENGHKIAFDPRDISESAERSKQPKLTLMEEVLLLGLKDKQVSARFLSICFNFSSPSLRLLCANSRALSCGN